MADTKGSPPALVWNGADYPRIPAGRYRAAATRFQGPEWLRKYSRWSLMIEFELLGDAEQVRVCAFLNMGNNREGPRAGRYSRFFKAWTIANGELPRKGQVMAPGIFLDGQVYEIAVADSRKDSDEKPKADCEVYSVVTDIVSAHFPNRPIPNPSIRNQESCSHPIKQSTNQVGHSASNAVASQVSPQPGEGNAQPKSIPKGRGVRSPLRPMENGIGR